MLCLMLNKPPPPPSPKDVSISEQGPGCRKSYRGTLKSILLVIHFLEFV